MLNRCIRVRLVGAARHCAGSDEAKQAGTAYSRKFIAPWALRIRTVSRHPGSIRVS